MIKAVSKVGFEERKFDTGEVTLNYVSGPSGGLPLVLIPGQAMSWENYQLVLPKLSDCFEVYALDLRGHGKSSWTPGAYTFNNLGQDMIAFLREVVKQPAIVSGHSSGGVLAVWLGAYAPELVRAIISEDPPLFNAEWPRIRKLYVYQVMEIMVETLGSSNNRGLAAFFSRIKVPVKGKQKVFQFPRPIKAGLSIFLKIHKKLRPGRPVQIPFLPLQSRLLLKYAQEYDVNFSRAFLDGSAGSNFDHADALSKISCPMLLLQANWFWHDELGLVGGMDDNDVARVKSLVPHLRYVRVDSGHAIHLEKPKDYIRELTNFVADFGLTR